ncbi:MAG TPA: YbaK/EbsC family protein [Actinopolymorphaceae bacterium]
MNADTPTPPVPDAARAAMGSLELQPALDNPHLLAESVLAALAAGVIPAEEVWVAAIDPALADTEALVGAYGVGLDVSANCVVVSGRRGERTSYAGCCVLATTRADVNGVVRRELDARKASFAPVDATLAATGMEYGGITPIGLPADWPVLVDAAVAATPWVCIGSGIRGSKLVVPGHRLAGLPRGRALALAIGSAG